MGGQPYPPRLSAGFDGAPGHAAAEAETEEEAEAFLGALVPRPPARIPR